MGFAECGAGFITLHLFDVKLKKCKEKEAFGMKEVMSWGPFPEGVGLLALSLSHLFFDLYKAIHSSKSALEEIAASA